MKITDIKLYHLSVPLKKPFKTALRTVNSAEDTIVKIFTDTGAVGHGEAAPTEVITGDSNESIRGIILNKIKPLLLGEEIAHLEKLIHLIQGAVVNNSSAKAAVDMAVYDLYAQLHGAPLFQLLGGYQDKIKSDLTISVNSPEEMSEDALEAVNSQYDTLKIKVGKNMRLDIERVKAVRQAVGKEIKLRLDANQGWTPKEAVTAITRMEDLGLDLELVEQPVKAHDLEGLKYVTDQVITPIMADESLFSPKDCFNLLQRRACDLINIKLMKAGGIYNALLINSVAEAYGIEAMIGSMLEAKVSVAAAVHLAAAKKNINRFDLDAPSLMAADPVRGGAEIKGSYLRPSVEPGLGISNIDNLKEIN